MPCTMHDRGVLTKAGTQSERTYGSPWHERRNQAHHKVGRTRSAIYPLMSPRAR
ncbi:hypothetical protein ACVWWN_003477 [Mycobacterium sp. URHB0021]|jgi:hypothetical protein